MVWGLRDTSENPKIIEMRGVDCSHISKSESYKFKLKQNNPTELLAISSPYIYHYCVFCVFLTLVAAFAIFAARSLDSRSDPTPQPGGL